jgi:NSS family neurotransmitter:Na+ symporter
VLSFSTLSEWRPVLDMTAFDLVTTIPTQIFLPVGGLLIAMFAAWCMPRQDAQAALGAGESGFLLWRTVVRWVSIPLAAVVLAAGLL